ncbi:MAG TPA: M17 family peptidase N-terminal domain-containing protein [Myxococcota bacterium]|nr:M17 family peptidase N-terminal domain-containing protein [Myxococcota bacterium]
MNDPEDGVLGIVVETGPIEKAAVELAVVTFFENDRPLRGEAGRVDWRLCGMLSDLLARGALRGAAGEAALIPTFGHLRAPRVLVLGLGSATGFGALEVKSMARAAVRRCIGLRVRSVALALPGHWTGLLPVGPCAAAVLRGTVAGLEETASGLRMRLVVPEGSAARALGGLETAVRQLSDHEVPVKIAGVEPLSVLSSPGLRDDLETSSSASPR